MTADRRRFLAHTAAWGLGGAGTVALLAAGPGDAGQKKDEGKKGGQAQAEEVSAPEDLMREHGVLNRVLLIYEEGLRRIRGNQEIAPEVFHRTATLVRRFVEDYHERLEERFIFPVFERRERLVDLIRVLRRQHTAGRALTDVVLRDAAADRFRRAENRQELTRACEAFIRMYRPHEAREDTVVFPALHGLMSAREMRELGERFEQEEDRLFGEDGFRRTVDQVATIERQLGIHDLDQFTPRVSR